MIDDDHSAARRRTEVDVLFFEVGDSVYGTDASQVLRIDRAHPDDIELPDLGAAQARAAARSSSSIPEVARATCKVDAVRGVRPVPSLDLRRLPAAAGAAPYASGVFLGPGAPRDAHRSR